MTGTTIVLFLMLLLSLPPAHAQVSFVSDRGGGMDIYVFDTDTSALRRITTPGEVESGLIWSRDGRYLYFVTYKVGDQNIWRIRPDGSGLEQVTTGTHARILNDLSPDGERMLINSKREHPRGEIYTMGIDGKDVRRITDNDFFEAGATYSPDGKTIAVSVQIAPSADGKGMGNAELYLLDTDGKELKRLTTTGSTFEALPDFSPDGTKLAYHACDGADCGIMLMDLAAGRTLQLTKGDPDSRRPRWTPDGTWIAYTRRSGADTDVWIVRPDGSGKRAFIVSPGRDEIAAFGPGGIVIPEGK